MLKLLLIVLLLLMTRPATCQADVIVLKSGEVLRGKLIEKNKRSYLFYLESTKETVDVPLGKASIVEVTPVKGETPKGSVIFFSETRTRPRTRETEHKKPADKSAAPAIAGRSVVAYKSPLDVLKVAQSTVAASNARTEETQQRIEQLKAIAEATN